MENFKKFYGNTKDRLFGYLIRLTGDYELSRDIMQDSYTRYLDRYGDRELKLSLLFTIARNGAMDYFRKRSRSEPMNDSTATAAEPADDGENAILIREEYRLVMRAMMRLPPADRDLLSMVISSGLSYREIAIMTNLSEANVKVKIHRIRVKLKEIRDGM
ncbi:MAG: RNA polymerase sigma factor [Desulfobacteraceae bacterium]|nr:RNA polymerase sigma factor [Desulfobacteraceae bacterium]